jgi:cephalosporin hydroxylase
VDTEADVTAITADYEVRCADNSDIALHLPFLYDSAQGGTVIELGVRTGNSTAAFLAAGAEVWSVDLEEPAVPGEWHENPRWHFLCGNDLDEEILAGLPARADVVFIDTAHTYDQTLAELRAYAPRARRLVLLHDTQWVPGGIDSGTPSGPVAQALDDYCAEAGLVWENRPGSFGLGVLRIA